MSFQAKKSHMLISYSSVISTRKAIYRNNGYQIDMFIFFVLILFAKGCRPPCLLLLRGNARSCSGLVHKDVLVVILNSISFFFSF